MRALKQIRFVSPSCVLVVGLLIATTSTVHAADPTDGKNTPAADSGKANTAKDNTAKNSTAKENAAKETAKAAALTSDLVKIPDNIRELLQDRKYDEAVTAIDAAAKAKDAPRDYLAYLKARALQLQQKYTEAATAYEQLEKDFPKSVWANRAKFGRAVALARNGDFNGAEAIYRGEAERLLSLDRKQEIAELYLEFADAYFKPKDEVLHQPDYAKALEFYTKALEVGPKSETRIEAELRVARCFQETNNPQEAIKRYQQFIKDHPSTPQEIEARFRLGEVQLSQGQPEEARRTWQDLLAAHADAKNDRIAEATYKIAETYGLPNPGSSEALNLGISALDNFLKKYPDHKLAPKAHLLVAESDINFGRHADAVKALDRFLGDNHYADREELADARNLLGRAYQLQKKFPEALAAWREYLAKHPAHHDWSQVQQQIVDTEYMYANEKSGLKQYDEARKLWTEFLAKYPLDPRCPRIMYLFGQMNYEQRKWDDAISDWRRLVSKYPDTNESSQAQFMIAGTLETKLGKLEEALVEYRKVKWGSFEPHAAMAAKRLTAKTLAIRTEREFRTNETPKIKLTSRNIESVTVRVYKIDLETYFRKMHEVRGIEGLDISLIDPDTTFEYKVPKYAEFQQLESDFEVPLPGKPTPTAGVMAVTVSSKTLEATTMVVQTDLDIIVKSSRDEVFVFAQNMRTGKAWPKAKLLFSNGQNVFADGATGADGVFQKSFKELKEAGDVRVFATAENSVASNVVDLSGVGVAQGLADKGYIYTDRPVYRAGQLVHVRGILRKASDDAYGIEKGKKYTVEVFDSRNRSVWQNDVTLSEFGTFHAHFLLPDTSPVGSYRLVVHDDENHSFAGSFTVNEYQLEPIKLAVETDRKVFYRGEEIEGKISAKFYYGAPLVGREIRYQLAGGKTETATTDDSGEVKFKLPTREFRETQVLPLAVSLPERNISTSQNFFLSTTGFSLNVSTVRPVYVSGESFEATIKVVDAEGKPIEQKLTLKVLEQTLVQGKVGEVEVAQHDLTTDAKTGVARKTLTLEKGARYVLRAEGIDRFNNPITGQSAIQISDNKDRIRLRILAEKHTFKTGDTAEVQLHWREAPALALVTFQGARILDYKLVTLQTGANKFSFPMTPKLAPNFNLEVAVMTDARTPQEPATAGTAEASAKSDADQSIVRFHVASSPFTVERNLNVELVVRRKGDANAPIRPGDEVELVVKATDPQGKPVSAELSVGMIEQSVLALAGWNVGPIDAFFRGNPREPAMRTNSSVTFAYQPATHPIDRHLLAEEERTEIAAEEAATLESLAAEAEAGGAEVVAETRETNGVIADGTIVSEDDSAQAGGDQFGVQLGLQNQLAMHDGRLALGVNVNSDAGYTSNFAIVGRQNRQADFDSLIDMISSTTDVDGNDVNGNGVLLGMHTIQQQNGNQAGQQGGNPQLGYLQSSAGGNRGRYVGGTQMRQGGFGANMGGGGMGGGGAPGFNFSQANTPLGNSGSDKALARSTNINGGTIALNGTNAFRSNGRTVLPNAAALAEPGPGVGGPGPGITTPFHRDFIVAKPVYEKNSESPVTIAAADIANGRFGKSAALPTAQNFNTYWNDGRKDLVVVLNNGMQCNVALNFEAGGQFDQASAGKAAAKLVAEGAVVLPQSGQQETGFWNPAVVTDAKGEAILTLTVPEQSTAWKLTARGITTDTLAGEAETDLVAKKDLFGELKLPLAFTDGDDADVIVTVHNQLIDKGPITVTLKTTIGGRTVEEKKTLEVTKKGIEEIVFKTQIRRPVPDKAAAATGEKSVKDVSATAIDPSLDASAVFELSVSATDAKNVEMKDALRRVVAVHPFGVPVYVAASGSANSDTSVWVEPPADMALEFQQLQILVGPTVEKSLLDVVLGAAPAAQLESARYASGIDSATSDLMASLALQKMFATSRNAGSPQVQALDARIRSVLSLLVSSQQDDGGWSWSGRGGASHRFTSARVMWALSMARKAGYKLADECFDKATKFLQSQIATTAETDFESKAILLHALSTAGVGDFTLANRLYRNRPALSNAALAYLVLAFIEMDRKPTAQELLADLGKRNLDDTTTRRTAESGSLPWGYSPVEVRALVAVALEQLTPEAPETKTAMDWLLAHRTGHRWSPEKATGPAALALARWFGRSRFDSEHYTLTVFVNDTEVKALDITSDTGSITVDVPRQLLKPGKQRVSFQLVGRGRYTFEAVLGGFVAADKLKTTTRDWQVQRFHEPAPMELDGQEIPRGFGNLQGSYTMFRNPLTQLPVGKRGHVQLQVSRLGLQGNTPDDQLEYLVVTEPLPSGVTVIEKSIAGGFERYELGPGSITFYLGNRRYPGDIQFDVHGYLPGHYRAGPTLIRDAYKPDRLAVSSTKELSVLPLGDKSDDAYRLTPIELFELAKREFAKKEMKSAGEHLDELLAKWNVNADTYKESARMLLDIRLETGPASQVVRYFEIIKEKWPDLEIPFEKIMKVGAAYHEIGEYERSYLVFRATVESSFLRENGVAGFLESQGEFLRSVEVMNRLLAEYPPEPYVASATFSLAQRVYAKAPHAADDPKLREKKITRVDLVQQALRMLDHFLTVYPEDPAADQAAFSLANAMLELKQYKPLIATATKFAQRYKDSEFLDSFWYIVAYSHFALGEHEQALEMARKVADAKHVDKQSGRETDSPNKWQAVYIMGQVFHSLGKAADAIAQYTKVEDRFADAKQAIEYFTRQDISLPEITTVKPGEAAEPELKFRNIAAADIKVYRIDLMKYSLLKRNLGGITEINLSGIRPLVEQDLKLGDGKDYRDRSQKLSLPLKEEGAYLVVCRGNDLYASGLVLVSPLAIDVQEEPPSGRVRVTVKNSLKDSYVPDVHVKAIGSRNADFVSGQTDLRGVFVGDNLQGTGTVIAQASGGRYAFFRGKQELGSPPTPQATAGAGSSPANPPPAADGKASRKGQKSEELLLQELQRGNNDVQIRNNGVLDNNYKQKSSGVKANAAF